MPSRWNVLLDAWRTRLWPLPTVAVIAAIALGVALPQLDLHLAGQASGFLEPYLFSGGPEAARTVLSAIAGSLITSTSLTFSLTVVTLQLASSQYSPRILRTFVQDRFVHLALAALLGTFTYSLTVLRTVRTSSDETDAFVPQLSVTLAYLLAVLSVLVLVLFLAHLAREIRAESMLRRVHADTMTTIRRVRNEDGEVTGVPLTPSSDARPVCARTSGFLTSVDGAALLRAAVAADLVLALDVSPGDSIVRGTPVALAWPVDGAAPVDDESWSAFTDRVDAALSVSFERTPAQDVGFGLRQLLDIILKAVSPGINDPTTAVHALSHVSAILCELAQDDLGTRLLRDDDRRIRVSLPRPDLPALLDMVLTQVRHYGAADPQVYDRSLRLLREVAWCTHRIEHHRAVERQLRKLADIGALTHVPAGERRADAVRAAMAGHWPIGVPVNSDATVDRHDAD